MPTQGAAAVPPITTAEVNNISAEPSEYFSCGSAVVTGADDAVRSPSPAYKLRAVSLALMQPTKSNTLAVRPETVTHPASSVMSWKIFATEHSTGAVRRW